VVDRLDAISIRSALAVASSVEMDVVVHRSIDSTNTWSLLQCKVGKKIPFACFAEQQTQGRGRRGKHWDMLPDSNIALSLAWSFEIALQQMNLLPVSIALAIVKTLEVIGLKDVQIKWPNDIYVGGKKIAGILIETQSMRAMQTATGIAKENNITAVIGVGLNYDMASMGFLSDVPEFTSSSVLTDICAALATQENPPIPERAFVAALLLQNMVRVCQNFSQEASQHLETFRYKYDFCNNKNVMIMLDDMTKLTGVACGVSALAELIVLVDGVERVFNSAEVSVTAGVEKSGDK